jgi:S1-C subfamily serine protease
MKRKAIYSRANRRRQLSEELISREDQANFWEPEQGPRLGVVLWAKTKAFINRHDRAVPATLAVLVALALVGGWELAFPPPKALTQWDIDNAVKYTLDHTPPLPADSTIAAAIVAPSVVRVDGYLSPEHAAQLEKEAEAEARKHGIKLPSDLNHKDEDDKAKDDKAKDKTAKNQKDNSTKTPDGKSDDEHPDSTGSGVVIDDKGDILTNLHVVSSTDRWVVTFADGSKSDAVMVNAQPENDLAVIKAKVQPDDLKPATLASTRDLNPGDTVVATGFPFGIGPSVSSGVVSGLKRSFVDPTDKTKPKLTNLIQFDAAVNPGNSGGPLVNRDGEVVGIVTAIYNPTGQHVFAGMSFAVPIENAAAAAGENPL